MGFKTGSAKALLRSLHSVHDQHGDGHRTDASGDRRDASRNLLHRREVHVASEFAVRGPVDPDIDDAGARFDHLSGDEFLAAHRGHEDIRELRQWIFRLTIGMSLGFISVLSAILVRGA